MSETIEKKFNVSKPARLAVNNVSGSVNIHPGEEGTIQVTAIKHPFTGDEKRTEIEITQETDGTVKASTHFPDGGWSWMFGSHPCDVDYVITVPPQCSIKVNGVSATMIAEGLEGDVNVNSVSGEITLKDMKGSLRIHSVSGDIEGENLDGKLNADTVSGDVEVKASTLSTINGKTVSGDIRISTPLADGPYDFKSVSGDVQLKLPSETRCTGELHSLSGDLSTSFPASGYSSNPGSKEVHVQGGGVKISLNSVSGDLSLDCDGEISSTPAAAKPISSEERKAVLESVERGEMTVEQALGKLQG
jgi:hypothetical protein